MRVDELRDFADTTVGVRLADGMELIGRLRVELLTERSIAVFLEPYDAAGEGATLYLADITAIWATTS